MSFRILYVSHSIPPVDQPLQNIGGMQNVSLQLMEELEHREDVELLSVVQRTPWSGIGSATTRFLFSLAATLPGKARAFRPDVVLFSSMVTAGVVPFLKGRFPWPSVVINHGQDVTLPFWVYQWYVPRIFRSMSGVISVSAATREACIERGMDPALGVALPNGLDVTRRTDLPDRSVSQERLKSRFGLDVQQGQHLLLTVGRHVLRKGHRWFVEEVLPNVESNVVYLIVGDGPETPTIRDAIRRMGMEEQVILSGRIPEEELQMAYSLADLFIMPNIPVPGDMEGFGIVLLEANQAGVPAVASDLEGIRDVIRPGINGYRVPHGEPILFAREVDRVLREELQELKKKCGPFVHDEFGWERVAERYVSYLKQVASREISPSVDA
ncbi:MAG: glycosyltransferase family 4 protein [Balneolaceae bacterium]